MTYIIRYYNKEGAVAYSMVESKDELEKKVKEVPQEGLEIRHNTLSYVDYCNQVGHGACLASNIMLNSYFSNSESL